MTKHSIDLQKITIYGPPGSGKTTLANDLGEILQCLDVHLDDLFHRPNWQSYPLVEFRAKVKDILKNDRWIFDGNYSKVRPLILEQATFAIILDLPLYLIIWRLIARTISRNTILKFHHYTPLPKEIEESGTKESIFTAIFELSRYAIRYKVRKLKQITEEVEETLGPDNYIVFKNEKQIELFLRYVKKNYQEKS